MSENHKMKDFPIPWGVVALIVLFLLAAVYAVYMVLSDDNPRSRSAITTVTLLKPPPPQIKEKLPEPEEVKIQRKEELIETVPQVDQDNSPGDSDNTPAGDNLGLDADGTAGSDSFGLIGKKGGRSLLAGEGGSGTGAMGKFSLLSRYAGYVQVVEREVRKGVMKKLDEDGGIPRGKLQTIATISVDQHGSINSFRIIGSSGNHKMDEAVRKSLHKVTLSEPPPDGMPRTMTIKITSAG